MKVKATQQKQVHKELQSTGKIHFKKRKELVEKDAVLIEEVNELQSERSTLLSALGLTDSHEVESHPAAGGRSGQAVRPVLGVFRAKQVGAKRI